MKKDVIKFISELDKKTRAKITRNIDLLKRYGYTLGPPITKLIDSNLYELRIRGNQEVRLFYTFSNKFIIIFYGFIKKQNKIPKQVMRLMYFKLAQISRI